MWCRVSRDAFGREYIINGNVRAWHSNFVTSSRTAHARRSLVPIIYCPVYNGQAVSTANIQLDAIIVHINLWFSAHNLSVFVYADARSLCAANTWLAQAVYSRTQTIV